MVGIVAGLGAVVFQLLSHLVVDYTLKIAAGYEPMPSGRMGYVQTRSYFLFGTFVPWMLLVVITIGGLISGIIVYSLAPEAEGHGTDAAIKAYHHERGLIRVRVPLVKIICSAITIGTGG